MPPNWYNEWKGKIIELSWHFHNLKGQILHAWLTDGLLWIIMSCYDERTMTSLIHGVVLSVLRRARDLFDTVRVALALATDYWLTATQAAHPSPPDIHNYVGLKGLFFLERPFLHFAGAICQHEGGGRCSLYYSEHQCHKKGSPNTCPSSTSHISVIE